MRPIIQVIRKSGGLPAVMLVDSPEGPPVTAEELSFLLRVAYLKLGESTVDKAIASARQDPDVADGRAQLGGAS
jgi:hypothetical protein